MGRKEKLRGEMLNSLVHYFDEGDVVDARRIRC